jgi:hypothetical protein
MDRIAKRPERSTKKKMGQIAKVLGALETRAQMKIFRKSCETDVEAAGWLDLASLRLYGLGLDSGK